MKEIFETISTTMIFDMIPLDLFLHFFFGLVITVVSLKNNLDLWQTFILLILVAGLKEFNDYVNVHPAGWEEYASDFLITMGYFFLIVALRYAMKKTDKSRRYKKLNIKY